MKNAEENTASMQEDSKEFKAKRQKCGVNPAIMCLPFQKIMEKVLSPCSDLPILDYEMREYYGKTSPDRAGMV